jgi:integrase
MRRFSLYRRGRFWYVQFFNPETRKYLSGLSTGETNRTAAEHAVDEWLRTGVPQLARGKRGVQGLLEVGTALSIIRREHLTFEDAERIVDVLRERELIETTIVKAGPGSEPLITFLERFWNYDLSPYVRERVAHGQRIGKRHCYDAAIWIRTYWKPQFGGELRLGEVRKSDLSAFSLLLTEKGLQPHTINNILNAGTVALRWARTNEIIATDPSLGLMRFSGKSAKKGILTEAEVKKLFELPWPDEHSKIGNALAMSTGLRAGEVAALQVRDIGEDRLFVRHSWNNWDRLKGTKTDTERSVPIIPSIREALLDLARRNPHGVGPTTFVFWSTGNASRPMDVDRLIEGLHGALPRITLNDEQMKDEAKRKDAVDYWKGRKIAFHSWRHYYAARMADRLEKRKVMVATGHTDGSIFDVYADHIAEETFQEVRSVAAETFGKLLPFKQ